MLCKKYLLIFSVHELTYAVLRIRRKRSNYFILSFEICFCLWGKLIFKYNSPLFFLLQVRGSRLPHSDDMSKKKKITVNKNQTMNFVTGLIQTLGVLHLVKYG